MAGDAHARTDLHPPPAQRPLDGSDHVGVGSREDCGQRLEQGHLGSQIAQHRRELASDDPATDDHRACGQLGELEHLVGGEYHRAVDGETRDGAGHRPGSEHDVLTDEFVGRAVRGRHRHGPVGAESSLPLVHGHLAVLQQTRDAAHQLVDHGALAGEEPGGIDPRVIGDDPELGRIGDTSVDCRGLEQFLGRNTSPVQTRTAHPVLFDQGDVQPGSRAVERRGITTGTCSDDDDVE